VCTAIGGAEAAAVLQRLLADPDPAARAAAAGGLGHLGHWPAAAALAAALRDPSWDVRRGAGLALSALGAPGELFLREALTDQDRFAADMARQILELPHSRAIGAAA
jgi:HEAT repeat protein